MKENNENQKLVSVVIPVFKVEKKWVEKCVDSVLNQSYKNIEIIIVDDGNNEEYRNFLYKIKEKSSRIHVVEHKKNLGLYHARLTGVNNSNGEYIAFVDSDDYIGIDWIRLLVKKAEESHSDIVMGQTISEDSNKTKFIYNSNYHICNQDDKNGEDIFEYLIKDCGLDFSIHTVWNKLYTKKLWDKAYKDLNRINKHLVMTEDIAFSMILFFYAQKMSFSSHDGYFYFRNENSSTVSTNDYAKCCKNIEDIKCVFDTVKQFLVDNNIYEKYERYFKEWMDRYFRWWSYTVKNVCETIEDENAVSLKKKFLSAFNKKEFSYSNKEDNYFYQSKTEWNPKFENLKKLVSSERIKVVSFDLFDTLITRPVLNPEDVYLFVVEKAYIGSFEKGFLCKIRKLAEAQARKEIAILNPDFEDVTLSEIYRAMHKIYNVPKEICESLKVSEEHIEIEFANRRNAGYEIYTLARSLGKKVYITSDMYLEKHTIEKILSKNGYDDYEELLLSSEHRALKTTGSLFEKLIEISRVDAKEIIHIGDNWNVDFLMAANKGLNSFFIPKTKDILLNYLGDMETGNAYGDALNNANSFIDKSKYFASLSNRCTTAVAANIMFDNPFVSFNKESNYNGSAYQFGAVALGQYMLGIVLWLLEVLNNNDSHKIHFSSRDGFYLKRIFDYYINAYDINIDTNYLFISRKAFIPIEIKNEEDILKIFDSCSLYANSPKSIIERYNKVLLPLEDNITEEYQKQGIDLNKSFENEDEFLRFLYILKDIQFDHIKAKKSYEKCEKYLKSAITNDKDVVFDLGYSGKLHNDIVKCTGLNIKGAYISKDGYSALKRIDANDLNIVSYYNATPSMQGIINEYIFSDRGPSCIGYEEDSGLGIEFESPMTDYVGDYVINEINRGAYDFVKLFVSSFKKNINLIKFMPLDCSLLYESFLINPRPFDKAIFNDCMIEDEFYGGIKRRELIDIWNWQINDRDLSPKKEIITKVEYVDRIIEKEPDNLKWEVYKREVLNRGLLSKMFYWLSIDKSFFRKRCLAYIKGKREN